MTAEFGYLESQASTWNVCSAGTSTVNVNLGQNVEVGSWTSSGAYRSDLTFVCFDLSDLPSDITNVYLQLYCSEGVATTTDVVFHVAVHDYGSTLTSADWLNPAALSALTPSVSLNTAGTGLSSGRQIFALEIPLSDINISGVNRFVIYTQDQADDTTPVPNIVYQILAMELSVKRAYVDPGGVANYRTEVLADSPQVNWRLDELSGTTAVDSSGNGEDGTYVNGPTLGQPSLLATGDGTAIILDETVNMYVESVDTFSSAATFSSGLALEAIVNINPGSPASFYSIPVGFEQNDEIDIQLYGAFSASSLYLISFGVYNVANNWTEHLVGELNTTHHIIAQFDGVSQNVVYVDGNVYWYVRPGDLQTYVAPALTAGTNPLLAGGDSFSDSMNGTLDEVSFYTHALSDTRARVHYKAMSSNDPGALNDSVGITSVFSFHTPRNAVSFSDVIDVTATYTYSTPSSHVGFSEAVGIIEQSFTTKLGNYTSAVLADSPQGYYHFNEASGTTATDSSGHGRDGTYSGTVTFLQTPFSSLPGHAVDFSDGSGSTQVAHVSIQTTAFSPGTGDFTIEGWIKVENDLSGFFGSGIFHTVNASGDTFDLIVFPANEFGTPKLTISSNWGTPDPAGDYPNDNAWHYFAVTSHDLGTNHSTITFYLDGVFVDSTTFGNGSTNMNLNTTAVAIGSSGFGSNDMRGQVDEWAVYNTALSSGRIAAHYAAAAGVTNYGVSLADTVGINATLSVGTGLLLPTVTSVSPNSGTALGGTIVSIVGTGFSGTTNVTFGSSPAASFVVNSSTSITATTRSHAVGLVDVQVTNANGSSSIVTADHFTYTPPAPSISTVTPSSGPATGGATVTILGGYFTTATAVKFGSTNASFVINSDSSITATTPAHSAGLANVTVVSPSGTSLPDTYTFNSLPDPASTVPSSASTTGGTSVVIHGVQFTGATAVYFGATPAASFVVNSDIQITAVTPPHAPGTVNIRVTTPSGTNP